MTTEPPETAYDLLERVAQHIEEEPKRYDQSTWAMLGRDFIAAKRGADAVPACGTVCCRAGWIVALHDGLESEPLRLASGALVATVASDAVSARAMQILDMDDAATDRLFDGDALELEAELEVSDDDGDFLDDDMPERGTLEYAKLGADGLRAFMAEHEEHLKARLLKDVPDLAK